MEKLFSLMLKDLHLNFLYHSRGVLVCQFLCLYLWKVPMSHHNGITSQKHHFSIEFGEGGGAPELATETEIHWVWKIEKRLQCRNNGTVWPTVKSINWGLKLEVFNKEVQENGLICMD